jgi:hypothetical protein
MGIRSRRRIISMRRAAYWELGEFGVPVLHRGYDAQQSVTWGEIQQLQQPTKKFTLPMRGSTDKRGWSQFIRNTAAIGIGILVGFSSLMDSGSFDDLNEQAEEEKMQPMHEEVAERQEQWEGSKTHEENYEPDVQFTGAAAWGSSRHDHFFKYYVPFRDLTGAHYAR